MKLRERRNTMLLSVSMFALLPGGLIPEPVKNCAGQLVNQAGEITRHVWFSHTKKDPRTGKEVARSCAIIVQHAFRDPKRPGDVVSQFTIVDPYYRAASVDWWYDCVVYPSGAGFSVRIVKASGHTNEPGQSPVIEGFITQAPLFGSGFIHWTDQAHALNRATFDRGFLMVTSP